MCGTCNECLAEVQSRVEFRTSTSRLLACGRCALTLADQHYGCVILAFVMPQISPWVASDGAYFRSEADTRTYQRTLDARSRRFAERVRGILARRATKREVA